MSAKFAINKIVETLKNTLPKGPIALHEPNFRKNEWEYVKDCIDTRWVSSVGKYVDRFEEMLKEYTGVDQAVAVVNGTAALHICLKLIGVESDDEVLIPSLTFIATANAVMYYNAVPHFVDCSLDTLGINPIKLESYLHEIAEIRGRECYNKQTGRRIKALVPMHTFGHPVDLDRLLEISQRFHIELVEDAAESLGSFYKGRHTGNWGRVAALSFNGNKVITTGGGGAILTNDKKLGEMAKHLTTTAKIKHQWAFIHDQVGYNYRLPNINAALGCAQLESLPLFVEQKRRLAETYKDVFANMEGVTFFTEPPFAKSNYWLNAILLDEALTCYRDELLEISNKAGIMTRPVWSLLHELPMFKQCPKMDLSIASSLERRIINIPSSSFLGEIYC